MFTGWAHISYRDPYLSVASWDGVAWQTENVESENGQMSSLAIDGQDNMIIGYYDSQHYRLNVNV